MFYCIRFALSLCKDESSTTHKLSRMLHRITKKVKKRMEIHTLLEMPPFQDITEEELLSLILAPEHAHRQYKPADFIRHAGRSISFSIHIVQRQCAYPNGQCGGEATHHRNAESPATACPGFCLCLRKPLPGKYRS